MKVFLFDMDGTLTPAREKITPSVVHALVNLQKHDYKIGIVSGSDMDYIREQCDLIFEDLILDHTEVMWLPCNGTKRHEISSSGGIKTIYEENMKDTLGKDLYAELVRVLIDSQIAVRYGLGGKDIPLSGTFIQYRGSMVNWCPIGRDASQEDRKAWKILDRKHAIRKRMLERLNCFPVLKNLEVRLGGDTSFDIFPSGWNKTFCLRNFEDSDDISFVGDRCDKDGNDKELYDAIKLRKKGKSFKTSGPKQTIEIINSVIKQEHPSETK